MEQLRIDGIRADGGTQVRAAIDPATVAEYAEAMTGGAVFPPVTVYFDGETHWLADGFHRLEAARLAGLDVLPADVLDGDLRSAVLHSVGANATHGLRRTNADKRAAVLRLLGDPEWSQWGDRDIARRCGVTHPFVGKLRAEVVTVTTSEPLTEAAELAELESVIAAGLETMTPAARELLFTSLYAGTLTPVEALDAGPAVWEELHASVREWYATAGARILTARGADDMPLLIAFIYEARTRQEWWAEFGLRAQRRAGALLAD